MLTPILDCTVKTALLNPIVLLFVYADRRHFIPTLGQLRAITGRFVPTMFNPAFHLVAEQRRWRLEMMSKAACPIAKLPLTKHFDGWAEKFQRCKDWRTQIMARLRAERPALVVISMARGYGRDGTGIWKQAGFEFFDQAWIQALNRTIGQLREMGSQVLLLGSTPDPIASVPEYPPGVLMMRQLVRHRCHRMRLAVRASRRRRGPPCPRAVSTRI